MVALLGDAEDKRSITAEAIDGMVVSSLDVVVRKYGAPAIALAVADGRGVAVAGYVPGWAASWQPVHDVADTAEAHRKSVEALASLFGSPAGAVPTRPQPESSPNHDVDIVDAIERTDGTFDYVISVTVPGQGPEEVALRLEAMPGASLASVTGSQGRVRATLKYETPHDGIADDLAALGFSVR